jgi:hypothetical protein
MLGRRPPTNPPTLPFRLWQLLFLAQLLIPDFTAAQATSWQAQLHDHPFFTTFSLPGFLLKQEPASVTQPLGFGGLASTRLSLLSRDGFTWTGTQFRLQELDVTDSYQPGRPVVLADVLALDEVVVRSLSNPGVSVGYGAEINFSLKRGGSAWHGQLSSYNTGAFLANNNLPAPAQRGAVLRPERFDWFTRNNVQSGGPLHKKVDLFVSGTGQWASQSVPTEPAGGLGTRLLLGNANGSVTLNQANRIDASLVSSRIIRDGWNLPAGLEALTGRRMAPPLRPNRGLKEEDHLDFVRLSWTHSFPPSSKLGSLQLRYGYSVAHLNSAAARHVPLDFSTIELTTGAAEGAPPLQNPAIRARHSIEAGFEPQFFRFAGKRHQIVAGARWEIAGVRNRFDAPPDFHAITADGVPAFVLELNTPTDSSLRVRKLSPFLADRIVLSSWLSADAGALFDFSRGSTPQFSPQGRSSVISWNHVSPRIGLTVAVPRVRQLVLRGSFARAYQTLAGRYVEFADPNSLGGVTYRWLDSNVDGRFEPRERGALLQRFGGPYSSIDPSLERPYVDEFSIGGELSLPWRSYFRIRLFRRDEKNRIAAVNTGVPFDTYRPRTILDPGPDFIPGTFDDQELTVYDQDPATFGRDQFLLTNPGLRTLNEGLQAEVGMSHSRFDWRASFVAEKTFGPTNPGNQVWENDSGVIGALFGDPNTLLNATGHSFFDRAFVGKFQAWWQSPLRMGGLEVSNILTYLDGLPFARRLLVKGLAQGPFLIDATIRGSPEGGNRTQFMLDWDLRLARGFLMGPGRFQIVADVLNVLNRASKLRENDLSGPRFTERLPLAIQPPRFARFGIGFQF